MIGRYWKFEMGFYVFFIMVYCFVYGERVGGEVWVEKFQGRIVCYGYGKWSFQLQCIVLGFYFFIIIGYLVVYFIIQVNGLCIGVGFILQVDCEVVMMGFVIIYMLFLVKFIFIIFWYWLYLLWKVRVLLFKVGIVSIDVISLGQEQVFVGVVVCLV